MQVRFDGNNLVCPNCGGQNLHQEVVAVFEREEDAARTVVTAVTRDSAETGLEDSETCENPSSRRHGVAIRFSCETCPDLPELTLAQHKGWTIVEWRRLPRQWGLNAGGKLMVVK